MITIAGVTYPMQAPVEEDFERAGDNVRTYNNSLASQVRSEKRRWTGTTSFLTAAEIATLRTNTAADVPVTCIDTIRSITITAMVRIRPSLSILSLYTVSLDIRET